MTNHTKKPGKKSELFICWLFKLNMYISFKTNILIQNEKEKKTMTHVIYYVLCLIFGGIIGSIIMYVCICDHYAIQRQKKEIRYVINGIKRFKRDGKIAVIKRAIKIFAHRCMDFNPESFRAFGKREFDNIASALSIHENQKYQYTSTYNDTVGIVHPLSQIFTHVSEAETQKKICENLCQAIGI